MALLESVQVDVFPESVDGFVSLGDHVARTPQGAAAMMIVGLLLYAQDEQVGQQCLAAIVDHGRLQEGHKGYQGWQLRTSDLQLIRTQVKGKAYLLQSYVKGTSPQNGYQLPEPPYVFEFSDNPHSGDANSGPYKVFVPSSGADTPRPVTVKRDPESGVWRVSEWSSLIVGIRKPEA